MALYVVPTPIGNLKDVTLRGIEVLKSVPIILCEDTRVARKLLSLLGIDYEEKKFLQFHDHNEEREIPKVLRILREGYDIALISDAGTPLLNDPGFKLIREIRLRYNREIKINVLPGATSITTALVNSGLPTDKFMFLGYMPRKTNDRRKLFNSLKESNKIIKCTYVAFESHFRLIKTLEAMLNVLGEKPKIALCKELTKKHEEVQIGRLDAIIKQIDSHKIKLKGEFVIIFSL